MSEGSNSPTKENIIKTDYERINEESCKETEPQLTPVEANKEDIPSDVRPKQIPDSGGGEIKIELILKPVGDAPIMKQKKWSLPGSRTIGWVNAFIRKYLKFTSEDSLFLYVNQSFAPTPDHTMQTLFDCFGSDGKLVLNYSKTQAWG